MAGNPYHDENGHYTSQRMKNQYINLKAEILGGK